MKKILVILLLGLHTEISAQSAQKEINDQVWKLFIKTFNEFDTEGFMAIHSRELVRSSRDDKSILNWNAYFEAQKQGDDRGKSRKSVRSIELHFIERISSAENAIDVGIYKTTSTSPGGEPRSFYGKFLVVLRTEQGRWKILVDTDSSEGGAIGEKDFMAAKPMD